MHDTAARENRCYRAGLGGSASNLSHTIAPSWLQLTARKRRVASPWGRQAPGSACDRLLPPPGRVAEPQKRAVLALPQPRDRRGERFYEQPATQRTNGALRTTCTAWFAGRDPPPCATGSRYGEPLRGANPTAALLPPLLALGDMGRRCAWTTASAMTLRV